MTYKSAGIILAAILATFAASGCSSKSSSQQEHLSVVQLRVSGSTPFMVKGDDFRELTRLPSIIDGQDANHYTRVGPTSTIAWLSSDDPANGSLIWFDIKSGKKRVLAHHGTDQEPWSTSAAVVVGHQVVYVETTTSGYESFPWRLYTVDWETGEEKRLAADSYFGIKDPPWPSPNTIQPKVIDGQVYFVAVDQFDSKSERSSVYRVPITGGAKPELVAPGVNDVYADGKKLRVAHDGELEQWDPALGKNGSVAGSAIAANCGSYFNEGVALTCNGKTRTLHIDSAKYGRFTVDTGSRETGYLRATSRWVAFSTSSQAYVVDLARHRLMRLKGTNVSPTDSFSGNELPYIRQQSKPPYDRSIPLISLLPKEP